jgi:hypothetical protein
VPACRCPGRCSSSRFLRSTIGSRPLWRQRNRRRARNDPQRATGALVLAVRVWRRRHHPAPRRVCHIRSRPGPSLVFSTAAALRATAPTSLSLPPGSACWEKSHDARDFRPLGLSLAHAAAIAHCHARRLSGGGSCLGKDRPPATPVLHTIWSIDALLVASRTPYSTYFVTIRWRAPQCRCSSLVGFILAAGSAILVAQAFGAPPVMLIALAPKSITARRDGNNVSARRGSGARRRPSDRDRYRGHPADEALSAA